MISFGSEFHIFAVLVLPMLLPSYLFVIFKTFISNFIVYDLKTNAFAESKRIKTMHNLIHFD